MNKSAFLTDPDVQAFLTWIPTRFFANGSFVHRWKDRQTAEDWSCDGLFAAFKSYRWNLKNWPLNKGELDDYRGRLRSAVSAGDSRTVCDISEDVLRWGGVIAHNGPYLRRRGAGFVNELLHMGVVLRAQETPSRAAMCWQSGDHTTECRMNAGFVKIYSVWLDYIVIYDGRVGGALGLLVRQFCEQTGRTKVPDALAFAYGSPKEAQNPRSPKTRNPSAGRYQFQRLRADSRFHSEQTMRASWLLRAALEAGPHPFSTGEDGFHELAAGLFMIGYDLPQSASEPMKTVRTAHWPHGVTDVL